MPHNQRSKIIKFLITPCRINDSNLCHVLELAPRELFYDAPLGEVYSDIDLKLNRTRFSLSFLTCALLFDMANIKNHHRVLLVGAESGYCALLASQLAKNVTAVEEDERLYLKLEENIEHFEMLNVTPVRTIFDESLSTGGAFDRIILYGAIPEVPHGFSNYLVKGGKIVCFLKRENNCALTAFFKGETLEQIAEEQCCAPELEYASQPTKRSFKL